MSVFGLLALAATLLAGAVGPAEAKFWGCKDDRGKVLSSRIVGSGVSRPAGGAVHYGYQRRHTQDFSAQSSRQRYHTRRNW